MNELILRTVTAVVTFMIILFGIQLFSPATITRAADSLPVSLPPAPSFCCCWRLTSKPSGR